MRNNKDKTDAVVAVPGWPKPLGKYAMQGLVGDIAKTIGPHTEADPAALVFQTLPAFGNVVGPGPHFLVEADKHYARLSVVLVGRSSRARKGTSRGYISKICREVDKDWSRHCVQTGLSSGEGLVQAVADNTDQDKRLMVFEDEFSGVLRVMQRYGNTLSNVPRVVSFNEERMILDCCDTRLSTLITVLVESGLRVGVEALALKWSDLDFQEGTVKVTQSKTSAGKRVVPMTALCKSALLEWQAATAGESVYVFYNVQNPARHIRSVKTAWHNALKSAGLTPFAIYSCRATFATRLAAAGTPDAIIDQLLGHARRDVLSFYTARVIEYLRDAIRGLEKLRKTKEKEPQNWSIPKAAVITKGSDLIQ